MKNIALGIMSGTSADGISIIAARFSARRYDVLAYDTFAYRRKMSALIRSAPDMKTTAISQLNFLLGHSFADAVNQFLKKHRIPRINICVIGSHGQTIYHGPDDAVPSTFQIGEPSVIAERTGVSVVSDFRTADVAAGGSGAPLIPFFDQLCYGGGSVRALQNIGGIGNVSVVGKSVKKAVAFDTGPGNCLMDLAVHSITRGKMAFDRNGSMARHGGINLRLVYKMAKHPYFRRPPPKSTGRELFNKHFMPADMHKLIRSSPRDALATLNYFTAYTIADSYRQFILPNHRPSEVLVSGGGVMNPVLMKNLSALLTPIQVRSISETGIHPQAKEPLAFALYAWLAVQGKSNHLPSATGASHIVLLGKITPGTNFKRTVLI